MEEDETLEEVELAAGEKRVDILDVKAGAVEAGAVEAGVVEAVALGAEAVKGATVPSNAVANTTAPSSSGLLSMVITRPFES